MKLFKKNILLIFILFVVLACSGTKEPQVENTVTLDSEKNKNDKSSKNSLLNEINVKVKTIKVDSFDKTAIAHGVTAADHQVIYSAEISGKIDFMGFELGDQVKKGKTLVRIDFLTLKAQANQASSSHDLANSTFDRISQLKKQGLISTQKSDEAYTSVITSKAQVAIAKANLRKSTIKANHFGIVAGKFTEEAEFVAPGTPLYKIVDYRKIVVEAQLAESQVSEVTKGSNVNVYIGALNETFAGIVDTVIPTADAVSKTFTVRIKIPNDDLKILIGMSAKIEISTTSFDNVIAVPQESVIESRDGQKTAYVVEGSVAKERVLETGITHNGKLIVKNGLEVGDKLVTLGQRDLMNGQPVNLIK